MNFSGGECPDCGHLTHRAEHDGVVRDRCVTDDCERGWFDPEDVE